MIIRDSFVVIQHYWSQKKSKKTKGCLAYEQSRLRQMGVVENVKSVTWNSILAMRLHDLQWLKSPKALHHYSSHHEAKQGIYRNLISPSLQFSQTLLAPIIPLESAFDCHSPCPWGVRGSSTWIWLWAATPGTLSKHLQGIAKSNWIAQKQRIIVSSEMKYNPPNLKCARLVQDTLEQSSREPLRVWDEYLSCDYSITATNTRIWHQLYNTPLGCTSLESEHHIQTYENFPHQADFFPEVFHIFPKLLFPKLLKKKKKAAFSQKQSSTCIAHLSFPGFVV